MHASPPPPSPLRLIAQAESSLDQSQAFSVEVPPLVLPVATLPPSNVLKFPALKQSKPRAAGATEQHQQQHKQHSRSRPHPVKVKPGRLPSSLSPIRRLAEREVNYFQDAIEKLHDELETGQWEHTIDMLALGDFLIQQAPTLAALHAVENYPRFQKFCQKRLHSTEAQEVELGRKLLSVGTWVWQLMHILQGDPHLTWSSSRAGGGGGGSIVSRLHWSIRDNLMRYCVSLHSLCNVSIPFVEQYAASIDKNAPDLLTEMRDLQASMSLLSSLGSISDWLTVLQNLSEIVQCFKKIRASINKIFYLVLEWVEEDRGFLQNIQDEMDSCQTQRQSWLLELGAIQKSQSQLASHLPRFVQTLQEEQKAVRSLQSQLRKCNQAREVVRDRLHQVDQELTMELYEHKSHSKRRRKLAGGGAQRLSLPDIREEEKKRRLTNRKTTLWKHWSRLNRHRDKIMADLQVKEKRVSSRLTELDTKTQLSQVLSEKGKNIHRQLSDLAVLMEDLKLLKEKKYALSTLRELHNFGHVLPVKHEATALEKACELLAGSDIKWAQLYRCLPMYPNRSEDQREKDIERIDWFSGRYDLPLREQIQLALKKWQLFYHRAEITHLLTGLRSAHYNQWADELESKFAKPTTAVTKTQTPANV